MWSIELKTEKMANKEKIDYLLLDIRELEKQVAGMRDAEIYPVSFFSQAFELSHKILNDLHLLESAQIEALRRQMEAHEQLIQSIPVRPASECPTVSAQTEINREPTAVETSAQAENPGQPDRLFTPSPDLEKKLSETFRDELPAGSAGPTSHAPSSGGPVSPHTLLAEKTGISLNEVLEKQNLSDFRKAFSLNDRFRFRRELFGGNEARMNQAVNDLNELHSYEESVAYLHNELKWNIEDAAVADFVKLLEKRFS